MRRILLAMTVILMMLSPVVAAAQPTVDESTFTSALTGDVVDLGTSGDITFLPEVYELSEGRAVAEEYIWFTYSWSNFEQVLIDGDIETTDYFDLTTGNMVEFYESFEIIDEEVSTDNAWFIAHAVYQATPLVVFYDFQLDALGDTDLVVMQFVEADHLAADMEFVQAEVTVGGNPLLPTTDAQEMQALVSSENTSTPDDATAEASTTTDRVRPRIAEPGNTTETTDPDLGALLTNATPDGTTDVDDPVSTAVAGAEWESLGLVSETEWVSPSFGTSVSWNGATWAFPVDYEYAIYLNEDPVYEVVTIETTDGLGYAFVTTEDAGDNSPRVQAEFWASPEYAETFDAGITVIETATTRTTASVVYETVNTRDQELYVVVTATFLEDGTVVYSQVSAAPDTIHEVYAQYVDGVQVNGAPIDLTYTVDDIIEISGN